ADETANGPVCCKICWASGSFGWRKPTVPRVSPRSHDNDGWALKIKVNAPGQKASANCRAVVGVSAAKTSSTWIEPIKTGGGDCLDRPFAANKTATAWGLNASAPTPYTVSVGNTINSRCPRASTAAAMAAARCSDCCASNCCVTLVIVPGLG